MTGKLVVIFVTICATGLATCGDLSKESEVSTIFVPYEANSVYYPYPFAKARHGRKVKVPVEMDMLPSLDVDTNSKTARATLANFLEGAYPVYYTPGHANGHFNGKISILQ